MGHDFVKMSRQVSVAVFLTSP